VVDADSHKFLEYIGTGEQGYKEGTFNEAKFYFTQGMSYHVNKE